MPVLTTALHLQQYCTNWDGLIPIHQLTGQMENQREISKTHSPSSIPKWSVQKFSGEWKLTADYSGLDVITPPLSADVTDMLELQYQLEPKAARCYNTNGVTNAFFSLPLAADWMSLLAFT